MKKNLIIVCLAIISLVSGAFAVYQKQRADKLEMQAQQNEQQARDLQRKAEEMQRLAGEQRMLAEQHLREALEQRDRAQQALDKN